MSKIATMVKLEIMESHHFMIEFSANKKKDFQLQALLKTKK